MFCLHLGIATFAKEKKVTVEGIPVVDAFVAVIYGGGGEVDREHLAIVLESGRTLHLDVVNETDYSSIPAGVGLKYEVNSSLRAERQSARLKATGAFGENGDFSYSKIAFEAVKKHLNKMFS